MNPETNLFERLNHVGNAIESERERCADLLARMPVGLVRPNGEPVPPHWPVFADGELVELKGYTFRVAHTGESYMVLEPTGPLVVGEGRR